MGWLDSDGWFLHSKRCWLGLQLHGSLDGLVYSSLLTHMTDSWWWPSPGSSGGLSARAPACGPSTPRWLSLLTAWQLSSYRENPNNECFKTKKSETSSPLKNLTHLCCVIGQSSHMPAHTQGGWRSQLHSRFRNGIQGREEADEWPCYNRINITFL